MSPQQLKLRKNQLDLEIFIGEALARAYNAQNMGDFRQASRAWSEWEALNIELQNIINKIKSIENYL
jgi:hypothetical protein